MTTYNAHISRNLAQKYGLETVEIIQQGAYISPAGQRVELAAAITNAVRGTAAYPPEFVYVSQHPGLYATHIEVENETSLSAARRLLNQGMTPAVLNFASATHPGGGFLDGARAQEEYLARSSGLYACLKDQPMYAFNRKQSDPIYTSYMLYSPAVPVFRADDGALLDEPYPVAIITAAAPFASHLPASRANEIEQTFRQRIAKVLWIGLEHHHDSLVLGAWGCGAFGNDGRLVSQWFYQALAGDFQGAFRQVIFAIVDWSEERRFIGPFESAFRKK